MQNSSLHNTLFLHTNVVNSCSRWSHH